MESVTKEVAMTAHQTELTFVPQGDGSLRCSCGGTIETTYTRLAPDVQGYPYLRIEDECTVCGARAAVIMRDDC